MEVGIRLRSRPSDAPEDVFSFELKPFIAEGGRVNVVSAYFVLDCEQLFEIRER